MNSPLVSIIVPVYKTPIPFLQRFLESALGQTLDDIEIIFVDDASPDDCPQTLDAAALKDDRITVLHKTVNGRAGMARGDGLALAKGEYILFADADDIIQPDMCRRMVDLAREADADIVTCSYTVSDENGKLIDRIQLPEAAYDRGNDRQRAKAYSRINYALWNKIYRHDVIRDLRFEQYEANIGEDTLFNIAALCRSRKTITTAYSGYDYIVHSTSATGRSSKGMPYLRTLEMSNKHIRQAVMELDDSSVGRKFMDRMTLRRYITGCGWTAEQRDMALRAEMWAYWQNYLRQEVLPEIRSCRLLAQICRALTAKCGAAAAYRWAMAASTLLDTQKVMDKIRRKSGL